MKKELLKIESKKYKELVDELARDREFVVEVPKRYKERNTETIFKMDIAIDDNGNPEYVMILKDRTIFNTLFSFLTIDELEAITKKLQEMNKK